MTSSVGKEGQTGGQPLGEQAEFLAEKMAEVRREISKAIVGQAEVVEGVLIALLAGGHVLLEGAPGLGKTMLVRTLAQAVAQKYSRIQFTPDLMPADVIGTSVVQENGDGRKSLGFQPGPIFTNLLLADEINRATPKTQSALLEAMQEKQVTVAHTSHLLEEQFFVMATQNPLEMEGTYPLPESQLDRFMLRLDLTYPALDDESRVLMRYTGVAAEPARAVSSAVPAGLVQEARAAAERVHVSPELCAYVLALAKASREHAQLSLGLSTRGALALLRAARILAGIEGAQFVAADDVKMVAPMVLPHRLMLTGDALLADVTEMDVVARILEQVPAPR